MSIKHPLFSETLDAADHTEMHNIIAVDPTAPVDSITVDSSGIVALAKPAYCSVTVTSTATAATNYNPFDADNYSSFTSTANVTESNIAYTQADGRFTVTNAGVYSITFTVNVLAAAVVAMQMNILVDGVGAYTISPLVHTSTDPNMFSTTIIKSLTAGQYINANLTCANNVTAYPGTTMTISLVR